MADANLLDILSKEKQLENMIIYGNVRCAISKPEYLSDSIKISDGFFALVDVLAFKCNGVDYFGGEYQDSKHIYFSKGSLVIALDDKSMIGKNVRVYGRTLKGCTIKKQRTKSNKDGIVAFAWTKQGGNWVIIPNKVIQLGKSDIKGTVLEDYIVSLVSGAPFKYPSSVEAFTEYSGVNDVKPIDNSSISGALTYSTDAIDLSKIPLNLVHRLKATKVSAFLDAVGESVSGLRKASKSEALRLENYIKNRVYQDEIDEVEPIVLEDYAESIILSFINNIASRYNINIGSGVKVKGKYFVDSFLDGLSSANFKNVSKERDDSDENDKDSKLKRFKSIEAIRKSVALDHKVLLPQNADSIYQMKNVFMYASMVIAEVTGVGISSIVANHNSMVTYNYLDTKEWFWCLINNPYICGMMGSGLNVLDCDRIYYAFGNDSYSEDCLQYRSLITMLNNIRDASSRSTLILKRTLLTMSSEYSKIGSRYIEKFGYPYSMECLYAITLMMGNLSKKVFSNYIDTRGTLAKLLEVGLIEEVNNGVILAKDLRKEYIIYKTLHEMGTELTDIEDSEIDNVIENFQKDRGFQLEPLQKDGVHLVKYRAGVLSGCAGSGKTTTSDCMVECFKKYLPNYSLRFGAPTGKAARRLAEVVGGGVKTIHSMFGIGLDGEAFLSRFDKPARKKNKEGESYIYILDEMAMCNTNLMFEIVDNLDSEDIVYFLGDIKQLSPIGKGSPFRSLMQFLPCVELGVSKRAAANGKINYNCGLINFVSDSYVVELQQGDDFDIVGCQDVDIQRNVINAFAKELGNFAEDDIQVVTGYQNDKYPWSTTNLNPYLQNLLRSETDLLYIYNNGRFMRNDRVIHTKRNAYDMPRFRMSSLGNFEEVVTFGVVNGELGKIVGCVRSVDCFIKPFVDDSNDETKELMDKEYVALLEKREKTSIDIRNEEAYKDENMYFVVVQVYDVDLKEDVYVLYHANHREGKDSDYYSKTFTGGDLAYLDLAYALTTHKMQGSQSPCIIIPLGSSSSPSFMNRNMINTMITRASKKVTLIGSVKGKESALTNGRRNTNIEDGEDVLSLLAR